MSKKKVNLRIQLADGNGKSIDGTIPSKGSLKRLFMRSGLRGLFKISSAGIRRSVDISLYQGNHDVKVSPNPTKETSGVIALFNGSEYELYRLFVPELLTHGAVCSRLLEAALNKERVFDELRLGSVQGDGSDLQKKHPDPEFSMPRVQNSGDKEDILALIPVLEELVSRVDADTRLLFELRGQRSSNQLALAAARQNGESEKSSACSPQVLEMMIARLNFFISELEGFLHSKEARFIREIAFKKSEHGSLLEQIKKAFNC